MIDSPSLFPAPAVAGRRQGFVRDMCVLLVVTLLFGLWGGTTYYHPDEVVDEALRALSNAGNPEYFHYPALVIYLQALVYWLIQSVDGNPVPFEWPGHILTVILSFVGVACAYLMARRLTDKRGLSLLAGAFVATSLTWVRNCHYVTVDVPLASLCIATAYLALTCFSASRKPTNRQLVLLGVMVGLTTSAKYNGALIALVVAVPLLLQERQRPLRFATKGLLCGAVALAVFLITNPYIILDYPLFHEHFSSRISEINAGRSGFYMENGWLFHLYHSLGEGYGAVPLILAAAGIVWLLFVKNISWSERMIIILFPLVFYAVMGNSKAAFIRHILPVIPFLGVFTALGIGWILERVKKASPARPVHFAAALLLSLTISPGAWSSLQHDQQLARGDTRQILENVFRNTDVNWKSYQLYCGRYTKLSAVDSGIKPRTFLTSTFSIFPDRDHLYVLFRTKPDVMVFDSFSHDRLLDRAPDQRPTQALRDCYCLTISPYNISKEEVPISPDSIYSPSPPDLAFRQMAGPYIEVYVNGMALAKHFQSACLAFGMSSDIKSAEEGYFFGHMTERPVE